MKHLFVGGPLHGSVEEARGPCWFVPVAVPVNVPWREDFPVTHTTNTLTYVRRKAFVLDKRMDVYVLSDLSNPDASLKDAYLMAGLYPGWQALS